MKINKLQLTNSPATEERFWLNHCLKKYEQVTNVILREVWKIYYHYRYLEFYHIRHSVRTSSEFTKGELSLPE